MQVFGRYEYQVTLLIAGVVKDQRDGHTQVEFGHFEQELADTLRISADERPQWQRRRVSFGTPNGYLRIVWENGPLLDNKAHRRYYHCSMSIS